MRQRLERLETEDLTAERVWTAEGVPVLSAAWRLPRPRADAGAPARRIGRYYRAQGRAFFRYCERILLPEAAARCREALSASSPLPCVRAELNYLVTWNGHGVWSLYTESREVTGERPSLYIRRSDTWDLRTGRPIPLSDLFPPGCRWKHALAALAKEEIRRQEACGAAQYRPDWHKLLRRRFNARNYYLTPEGLCFFYPMYAIAPAAEGVPVFTLPWEAEPRILRPVRPGEGAEA